jgi:DNA repair protein RadA/Sms
MAKNKITTVFFCKECGNESSKWMGQCPACHAWNSFTEEKVRSDGGGKSTRSSVNRQSAKPSVLKDINPEKEGRISTGSGELDRVLGGGIVKGSLVLIGGDPGIGKSTILLQMMQRLSAEDRDVLYVSGEESLSQIKMRADRIGSFTDKMKLFCETDLSLVEATLEKEKPQVCVIDSIQTMYDEDITSAPGSVSQIRAATAVFMRIAKSLGITVFLVGHVTKEGAVAGPRVLEHMVDTVLYFEGDRHVSYRILRAVKNRFGSTNEIGVFEMRQEGLVEVENPSEFMLSGRPEGESGSVTACIMEGTRPMLLEIQALVCRTNFGLPRRTAAGTDLNRMNLLIAVLEKRAGIPLSGCDAYINVAGGMKINEPALDLATMLALVSSYEDLVISDKILCFGEVGLSGEVRGVSMALQRIQEAKRLGFTKVILPMSNLSAAKTEGIELIGVRNIREAIAAVKE